jgi:hypothetical protein
VIGKEGPSPSLAFLLYACALPKTSQLRAQSPEPAQRQRHRSKNIASTLTVHADLCRIHAGRSSTCVLLS